MSLAPRRADFHTRVVSQGQRQVHQRYRISSACTKQELKFFGGMGQFNAREAFLARVLLFYAQVQPLMLEEKLCTKTPNSVTWGRKLRSVGRQAIVVLLQNSRQGMIFPPHFPVMDIGCKQGCLGKKKGKPRQISFTPVPNGKESQKAKSVSLL